jgi:hypothetical protein
VWRRKLDLDTIDECRSPEEVREKCTGGKARNCEMDGLFHSKFPDFAVAVFLLRRFFFEIDYSVFEEEE